MKSNSFKSFARKNIVVIFLVMLCLGFGIGTSDVFSTGNIGGIVKTSSFLSASNIVNLTTQMAINAMLSAGLTYVIILGGIDISVGSVAALAGIVSMLVAQKLPNVSVFGAILVLVLSAVVVGGICGAFNGIMITKFKVVPMITTLAMLNMARGLCFVLSGGTAVFGVANNYSWLGGSRFLQTPDKPTGWIPVITLFVVLCVFIMHTLLSKTVFGRHVYATGSNIKVAHLSGINTDRVTLICHILCAVMAALGGVLNASKLQNGLRRLRNVRHSRNGAGRNISFRRPRLGGQGDVRRSNNSRNKQRHEPYAHKLLLAEGCNRTYHTAGGNTGYGSV